MSEYTSEVRDGMRIDWDVPITMDDGLVVRADVYRPVRDGKYPVLLSYGPYGKWLHFEDLYTDQWQRMEEKHKEPNPHQAGFFQLCQVHRQIPGAQAGQALQCKEIRAFDR